MEEKKKNVIDKIIYDICGIDFTPESKLVEDLGFDSIDNLELINDLEFDFNFLLYDEDIEKMETIQNVYDVVEGRLYECG